MANFRFYYAFFAKNMDFEEFFHVDLESGVRFASKLIVDKLGGGVQMSPIFHISIHIQPIWPNICIKIDFQ